MKNKLILLTFLSIFISGCATWQLITTSSKWRYLNFESTLPEGWMKYSSPDNLLFLTKDGGLLQNIRIYRYKIDKELPISKKKFTDKMLLQEISEVYINELSLDQNKHKFKILENIPVSISGREAFRLRYTFTTPDNLKLKTIVYGFKEKNYVFFIQYEAAEQYYFNKDINVFVKFINDFKIF